MHEQRAPGSKLSANDAATPGRVGVLGATSLVGACLLPMLIDARWQVVAFSRHAASRFGEGVRWRQLPLPEAPPSDPSAGSNAEPTPFWICVAPIWVLPGYFKLLESSGARRVVIMSSTSRFSKDSSSDPQEKAVAQRLADAEALVQHWAEAQGIEWVMLRPTLIYGLGRDKNISEIARFIQRFGFFPLFGDANGLRQPVHAADVATACQSALQAASITNKAYNISGGETLVYRDMVMRVFVSVNRKPRLLKISRSVFRLAVAILRQVPRYQQWSIAMVDRMNTDLVFDHLGAARDLQFAPRPFILTTSDLPE